jgi:hypothetical protein
MATTVKVDIDLQTVICQVPSVSRESVAAAKLQQPADASLTIWWRQLYQKKVCRNLQIQPPRVHQKEGTAPSRLDGLDGAARALISLTIRR